MQRIFLVVLAAHLASACAPDGTVPLDGAGVPDRVQRAVDLGRVPPDALLDFVVGLSLHDRPRLHKLIAERSPGEDGLGPDDFADRFAPSPAEYARLVSWLRAHDFRVTRMTRGRTTISARGTAAAIERLFGVELHDFVDAAGQFRAAGAPLRLSAELVDIVGGVVGLSGTAGWRSHLAWPQVSPGRLLPADLHSLYNSAGVANPGQGETVAILGTGKPPDAAVDVGGFMQDFKPYGETQAPGYQQVFVGGPDRQDAAASNGDYVENCLDAEMALAMAPHATVVHVLTATNSPGLFTDGIAYIVNQVPQAHAVSVSYGTCERGVASEMPVMDTLLEQALAEGQTWFFASGDTGTDGCRDGSGNQHISAGWPASSPHAVGVGGTMVAFDGTEVTWNENSSTKSAAGGGGPSEAFVKPAYQMSATPADGARDTPDVAAIAGGGGVWVSVSGRHFAVGGTSAAAPIWAGVWALVDQGRGGSGIVDALTKLYAVGKTAAFHDITIGDNGGPDGMSPGYPAVPGYDLATGWGSPDVVQLIAHLP